MQLFSSTLVRSLIFFIVGTPLLFNWQLGKGQEIDQEQDEAMIESIFEEAMLRGNAYSQLNYICTEIGSRLSGSDNAQKAVERTAFVMDSLAFDDVFMQKCTVPQWVRGEKEQAEIIINDKPTEVAVCALGGSIATPNDGILAEVVEVQNFLDLKKLGRENIEGKIVFYNRPMNPVHLYTFAAYSGSVDQRWAGAMRAAEFGAVGTVVRSMTLKLDDYPHTGSMGYADSIPKIPAIAISTKGAELLHQVLKENEKAQFYFKTSSKTLPDATSYNVVGEIKGATHPDELIAVGGHLDSWDLGQGAHDDGAGCVQSIEALRILKVIGYKPKRTLRAVMFMNEENGLRGAKTYAELAQKNNEKHIAAIESDRGGFAPKGFHYEANDEQEQFIQAIQLLFEKYGIYEFKKGYGGADIGQLREQGDIIMLGLVPESQRYFDYHHAASDNIEAVNKRELHSGAAAMAAMIYLLDKYGI